MKTFFSKLYNIKKFFLLIIILLISRTLIAQQDAVNGPFTYSPPDNLVHLFWSNDNSDFKQQLNLRMDTVPSSSYPQDNGIMVKFNLKFNCNPTGNVSRIIHFFDSSLINNTEGSYQPLISFEYSNQSIIIKRYWTYGKFYDYTSYDQLFDSTEGTYEIKIYVTADFMFIASKNLGSGENKSYLSPVLFGLNLPGKDSMKKFIERNSSTSIRVGNEDNILCISSTELYSFSYSELRRNILDNFVNK
jgi:hypothetical protein